RGAGRPVVIRGGGGPAPPGMAGPPAQPATSGMYTALGIQHVDERFSIVVQAQHASSGFRDVGDVSGLRRPEERYIAQAGWSMAHAGSLQGAFVEQRNADDTRQQTSALTYQVNVGHGSLGVNASRTSGDTRDTSFYVFYSLPLG